MKALIYISIILSSTFNHILPTIIEIESQGQIDVVGDNGRAYGLLQIHKICVDDVNRIYSTHYTHQQMFNQQCAQEVFSLYLKAGVNMYIKKHGTMPKEVDIVRMWNGGIYSGYKRSTTIKYWKRYLKIKYNVKRTRSTDLQKRQNSWSNRH